jgi:predicted nucleotidyltransferase
MSEEASTGPGQTADIAEDVFLQVLSDALAALDASRIPHLLMGGVASAALGRERWTHDIDIFVAPDDAGRALEALETRRFRTERTDEEWLYKGFRDGAMVDVIFRSEHDIVLDAEMLRRAPRCSVGDLSVAVLPAEDQIVIKAVVHKERRPRDWYDALALLATPDLDWPYLSRRADHGPERVLSLLVYARAEGIDVPHDVVHDLFCRIYGPRKEA